MALRDQARAGAMVVVGALVAALLSEGCNYQQQRAALRIELGMTRAEVEKLLGTKQLECPAETMPVATYFAFSRSIPKQQMKADGEALERHTDSILVYGFAESDWCVCSYEEAAIGIREGRVLWVVPICGDSTVRYDLELLQKDSAGLPSTRQEN